MTINTLQRQNIDFVLKDYFEEFQEANPAIGLSALNSIQDDAEWARVESLIDGGLLNATRLLRDVIRVENVTAPGALSLNRDNRPGFDESITTTDVRVYVKERIADHIIWAQIRSNAYDRIQILEHDKEALELHVDQLTAEGLTKDEAIANLDKQIADLITDRDQKIAAEKALADERIREREAGLQVAVRGPEEVQRAVQAEPAVGEPFSQDQMTSIMQQLVHSMNDMQVQLRDNRNQLQILQVDNERLALALIEVKEENQVILVDLDKTKKELRATKEDLDKTKSTMNNHVVVFNNKLDVVDTKADEAKVDAKAADIKAESAKAVAVDAYSLARDADIKTDKTNEKLAKATEIAENTQASTDRLAKNVNDFTTKAGVALTVIGSSVAAAAAAPALLTGVVGAELATATTTYLGGAKVVSGIGAVLGGAGSVDAGKEVGKWASDYIKGSDKKSLGGRDR